MGFTGIIGEHELYDTEKIDVLLNRLNPDNTKEKELKEFLTDLKKKIKNKKIVVKYHYPSNRKNDKIGRLYPYVSNKFSYNSQKTYKGLCYTSMPCDLRAFLAKDLYQYIDLSCCFPNIINQVLKYYNIPNEYLNSYCCNRNEFCKKYDCDKVFINTLINNNHKNCYKKYNKKNQIFGSIHKSIYTNLLPELIKNEPFKKYYETIEEKDNKTGTFIGMFCQTIEREVILKAIKFLNALNFSVEAYVFDGLFISKSKKITEDILEDISQKIYKEDIFIWNFDLKFKIEDLYKEEQGQLQEIYNRQEKDEPSVDESEFELAYNEWKEQFEKYFFRCSADDCFYVEPYNNNHEGLKQYKSFGSLFEKLQPDCYYGKMIADKFNDKTPAYIMTWKTDFQKREYSKIDFYPKTIDDPTFYNTWSGFNLASKSATDEYDDDVQAFKNYLIHMASSNDGVFSTERYDYLLEYLAHLIQCPYEKPGIILILYSNEEGTGKGTFCTLIRYLIGFKHFISCSDPEHVVGRFNDSLSRKLVVCLDDLGSDSLKKYDGKIRSVVTEPSLVLEGKGLEKRQESSFHRIVISTNKSNILFLNNTDRRTVIIEPGIMDNQLADKIYDVIENRPQNIFQFLLGQKVSRHSISAWQANRPESDAYLSSKANCVPVPYKWLNNFIQDPENFDEQNTINEKLQMQNVKHFTKEFISESYFNYTGQDKNDRKNIDYLWKLINKVNGVSSGRIRCDKVRKYIFYLDKIAISKWFKTNKYVFEEFFNDDIQMSEHEMNNLFRSE